MLRSALLVVLLHLCFGGKAPYVSAPVGRPAGQPIKPRPLDILVDRTRGELAVRTSIASFVSNEGPARVELDLYSMVHVADRRYYEQIQSRMDAYDVVLYELITDDANTMTNGHRRQLLGSIDLYSAKTEALARAYGLDDQLSLDLAQPNWYIADLDAAAVRRLEGPRKPDVLKTFWASRMGGRAFGQLYLKSFFLEDATFITILRLISWLAPCPEISCLLVDWSRSSTPSKGGGVPLFTAVIPFCMNLVNCRFAEARRIAFAQQLLTGLPDSGRFGGEAMSDTDVLVRARNEECMRVVDLFVAEANNRSSGSGERAECKIALLYGAYHCIDLQSRLRSRGFALTRSSTATAWTMSYPSGGAEDHDVATAREALSVAALGLAYLLLGAADWFILLRFTSDALLAGGPADLLGLALWTLLYAQRHVFVLNGLSSAVVWDRPLFSAL